VPRDQVVAQPPFRALVPASLAGCAGLLAWALLAQRLGAWSAGILSLSPLMPLALASLVCLWPSALAAHAGRREPLLRAERRTLSLPAEVNDGTA
jgi:hypothetical protein